jgi:hypothetical protein
MNIDDFLDTICLLRNYKPIFSYYTIIIDLRNSILNFNINELKYLGNLLNKEAYKFKSISLVLYINTPIQAAYSYLLQNHLWKSSININIYSSYSSIQNILK